MCTRVRTPCAHIPCERMCLAAHVSVCMCDACACSGGHIRGAPPSKPNCKVSHLPAGSTLRPSVRTRGGTLGLEAPSSGVASASPGRAHWPQVQEASGPAPAQTAWSRKALVTQDGADGRQSPSVSGAVR